MHLGVDARTGTGVGRRRRTVARAFPLGYVDFDLCIRVAHCGWIVETLSTSLVRHKWHQSTPPALRAYTVQRNAKPVRKWHAAWLAERPEQATLEEMRSRLETRARSIRAKPPPAGRHPQPLTAAGLARLERIARRGSLRVRLAKLKAMFERSEAAET